MSIKQFRNRNLIKLGVALGAFLFVIEAAFHSFAMMEGTLFQQLFSPTSHELWSRSIVLLVCILAGILLHYAYKRGDSYAQSLQKSAIDLKSFFNDLPDAAILIDERNRIVDLNRPAEALTGLTRSQVLHEDFNSLFELMSDENSTDGAQTLVTRKPLADGFVRYYLAGTDQAETVIDIQQFPLHFKNKHLSFGIMRDRTSQTKLDTAIRGIADRISSSTGDEFFQKLVLSLSETLRTAYVFVAQFDGPDPVCATTRAACMDKAIVDNITYELSKTPCEQVSIHGTCHFPSNAQLLFPESHLLAKLNIDSYLGFPLCGVDGKQIGILVIADLKPMPDAELAKSIVEIFASRAAAELERSAAEKALRESEESLKATISSMDDLLLILDKEGVFLDYHAPEDEDYFFFEKPENFLGKSFYDIISPPNRENIHLAFRDAIDNVKTVSVDHPFEMGGNTFWFNARFTPRKDSEGNITGATVVVHETTDRVRSEEALRNSEAALRATLESTGDGIVVADGKGKIIESNSRFAEMWNMPQHIIDSGDDELSIQTAIEQLVDPEAFLKKMHELYQSIEEDFDILHFKDGRVFERFSSPLIINNEAAGRVWSFRDISDRVHAEEELRRNKVMVDKSNISIMWIHHDGSLLDINEAGCSKLQYSREELLGMSVFDFDKQFSREKWETSWQQTKQLSKSNIVSEHTRKDGHVIPVEIVSNHIEYNGEEFQCCFVTDITRRRRNETIQSVLYEISEATGRVNSLVDLLEVIHKQVGRLIDTNNFYVALYDRATDLYSFPYLRDATSVNPEEIPPQELKRSFTDYVRRTGQAVLMTKEDQIALIKSGEADLVGELSEIWMGIPLLLSDHVIGVVGIQSYTNEAQYTHQDKDLMSIVASSIAMAIDRKRSESDLATANQMMRNVLDTIPVRVFWKDVRSVYLGCNELFALDAGYECAEEVIGKTDFEMKWLDRAETYYHSDRDIIDSGIPKLDYVEPITLPDNSSGWAHSSKIPLRDTMDKIVGVLGVYQDITDRIRAEEAVIHERDIAQRYLNIAGVLLLALDTEGVITMINPKGCSILGYKHDELIGKNWFDKFVPFDTREAIRAEFRKLINGEKGEVCCFENPVLTASGERRLIFWNDTLVRDEVGQVIGTLSSGEDITDRKRNEAVLKEKEANLAEAQRIAKVGSWEYNIEEDHIEASDEIYRIFGLNPKNRVTRAGVFTTLTHPDDRQRVEESNRATNENGERADIKYRIVRPNGEIRHVHEQAQVKRDQNGRPILVFGTVQDITELVKAEEERKALETQLRRTQRLETIGTLAGGIAHDFNNILTPILGYADMALISVPEDHDVRQDLEHVIKAAHRAKELVKQILTFSRQGDQEKKPLEIHLIVKEVLELLRASLPSTISISQNIRKDCGSVLADPSQIHQVIMNLCTNAFHAMRNSGGTLKVSLTLDNEYAKARPGLNDQPYIRISISDTGHGMNKETMERIFEPFFTTKGVGEGTGLGLSVVHGIITNHGGDITVESEQNKGTTFHIFLPQVKQAVSESNSSSCQTTGGNEHILVVDDEEEITNMTKRMLDKFGYRVTTRNSSVDALKLFSASPREFDLVVLDQTMPYLTGSELASELMAIRPDIPVIIITGYSESITAKDARRLGIRDYLNKPLIASELNTAIRKQLGKLKTSEV